MRPPEFTGGNLRVVLFDPGGQVAASMRPPEFTGGNPPTAVTTRHGEVRASMRPPEFTGGNALGVVWVNPAHVVLQ